MTGYMGQDSLGRELLAVASCPTAPPHVGKEMLALISLRLFARSGHIGSFRSMVGDAAMCVMGDLGASLALAHCHAPTISAILSPIRKPSHRRGVSVRRNLPSAVVFTSTTGAGVRTLRFVQLGWMAILLRQSRAHFQEILL
jgi:hypothetical protein